MTLPETLESQHQHLETQWWQTSMYIHLFSFNNLCCYFYVLLYFIDILIFFLNNCLYMLLVYLCFSSSRVYLYFSILMYVTRHEQFEIGCGTILYKIYYYYTIACAPQCFITDNLCNIYLCSSSFIQNLDKIIRKHNFCH